MVAESPAVAAIVVFESADTEVRDPAPVVADLPVVDELVAHLPIIDVVASLPVVDVPTAVITVDLVADTAPVMPEPVIAQAPADAPVVAPAVDLVPAVDVPALPTAPVVDNPLADCPPQALADFGLAREKKNRLATPTSTELSILGKQGAAVGLTTAQVIMLCASEGWAWFQSKWATPPVMERFRAEWMPGQAPATPPQRFYQPEVAPPASPAIVEANRAAIAALREKINRQALGNKTWATTALAKAAAGDHVAPATLAAARAALRL